VNRLGLAIDVDIVGEADIIGTISPSSSWCDVV